MKYDKLVFLILPLLVNYGNVAAQTFTEIPTLLTQVDRSSVAWGDYNNDGWLDILLTGHTGIGNIKIYKNNKDDSFSEIAALPGVFASAADWGDYDNDGDLDILVIGVEKRAENTNPIPTIAKVYRNNSGSFTENDMINIFPDGLGYGSVAWGDYDNDGDLDILLTGDADNKNLNARIYRNQKGNFILDIDTLPASEGSRAAWGDYDNDGDLDILLTGGGKSDVYMNDKGTFTLIAAELPGVKNSSAVWGDCNNDGKLDILLTGDKGALNRVSIVYINNGNNTFNGNKVPPLPGVDRSSAAWGDYDNDGALDILLTGQTVSGSPEQRISKIYHNDIATKNSPPNPPSGLRAFVKGDTVVFEWNPSTDDKTPAKALTYNLRVGITSKGVQIVSPMADRNTGYRYVAKLGNTNHNTKWKINNLNPRTYYWSVQAIDHAFHGSSFAQEQSVNVGSNNPPVVVNKISDQTLVLEKPPYHSQFDFFFNVP
jgi:predicted nucleotidyltransferase